MAEQHHHKPKETLTNTEHAETSRDSFREAHERSSKLEKSTEQNKDVEAIRREVEDKAEKSAEVSPKTDEESSDKHHYGISKDLKESSYKRTLDTAYVHLSKSEKVLSKLVHQPAVEKVSEMSARTIARPTGIAVGGILALVGTIIALFVASRYGYSYNFLLVIILYAVGYLFGTLLELFVKLFKKNN